MNFQFYRRLTDVFELIATEAKEDFQFYRRLTVKIYFLSKLD